MPKLQTTCSRSRRCFEGPLPIHTSSRRGSTPNGLPKPCLHGSRPEQIGRLKETPLFAQYDLGFSKFKHCTEMQGLWDPAVLAHLRDQAGRAFGVPVSGRINISAHKLVTGQHGSIHTDNEPGETHRLVVQLNRGRANDSGGNLVLLSGPTPTDMAVVFKQASNSAVGFGLGPASHHAIGRVRTGTRFTVIYTFLSDAATDAKYNYFVAA